MVPDYKPEPFTDFSRPENQQAFEEALHKVEQQMGQTYPLIIGGQPIHTEEYITSRNPSRTSEIVGHVGKADQQLAQQAMDSAAKTYLHWKEVSGVERARILLKTAAMLRRRKHEFSAWLVKEVGKSWPEADGDTAEAIDFMEFYARQMIRLSEPQELTTIEGEDNEFFYLPLGVGIVIPPWNFPLAIMCGMTVSALVTGNTVLLKPASTAAVIAFKFQELLKEAGLPDGVLQYIPGPGGELGDFLVQHAQTRFISFTGSRDVGVRINEFASKRSQEQQWIKRVIAEMGGKNTVVVDADADIDIAIKNIVSSSFGFSGQKCSAGSRAVIHESIYDEVLQGVIAATDKLNVGDVRHFQTNTGPVIDDGAVDKIMSYIEIGKQEGRLVQGGHRGPEDGYYVQPTIFADVHPQARIMQEEIFGPVLAFCKASNFDEAIQIANNTEYGLTGSVFSRNRSHLEQARRQFFVGNLYFNRKSTGAIVGPHPFGGFNMSGTNAKTGHPDYLKLFMQVKAVSEAL